jgi:hypothetical protein
MNAAEPEIAEVLAQTALFPFAAVLMVCAGRRAGVINKLPRTNIAARKLQLAAGFAVFIVPPTETFYKWGNQLPHPRCSQLEGSATT